MSLRQTLTKPYYGFPVTHSSAFLFPPYYLSVTKWATLSNEVNAGNPLLQYFGVVHEVVEQLPNVAVTQVVRWVDLEKSIRKAREQSIG